MQSNARMLRLTLCLSSLALASCASGAPTSPENFSETVRDVAAEQKAADCGFMRGDGKLPDLIIAQLDALPEDEATWTPDQKALNAWMNRDSERVERRKTYCGE